jgi:hypothetical protein
MLLPNLKIKKAYLRAILVIFLQMVNANDLVVSGAYINANAGFGTMQYLPTGSFAATLNAGYAFNRSFGLEGGYAWLPSSQYGASQYNNIFDVAAKGTLPLSKVFSLYGRLGAGVNYQSFSGTTNPGTPSSYCQNSTLTNFVGLAGVGGSFALSNHFDLRVEDTIYVPFGGGNQSAGATNLVLGGVQYNF